MKKIIFTSFALIFSVFAWAEYSMLIHRSEGKTTVANCESLDSVKCVGKNLKLFKKSAESVGEITEILFSTLDSVTFLDADALIPRDTVYLTFSDNMVKCVNPYESSVNITTEGACVTVKSSAYYKDIVYVLSGSASDGFFAIDSERRFKVILNNLTLTSKKVTSPIRSFSKKTMSIMLKGNNTLTDSPTDTCNAVIRSKGQIVFEASNGSLVVDAKQKRGIQSGDYVQINGGKISISSVLGNCIRANDYFYMTDGSLTMNGGGLNVTNGYFQMDGGSMSVSSSLKDVKIIDVETEFVDEDGDTIADATHGAFYLNKGDIAFNVRGDGSRFVKTDGDIVVKGGSIKGLMAGSSFLADDGEVENATAMKAGGVIKFLGGVHALSSSPSALGVRLLSSDNGMTFGGGVDISLADSSDLFRYVNSNGEDDAKNPAAIKSDNPVSINLCNMYIRTDNYSSGIWTEADIEINDGAVIVADCKQECIRIKKDRGSAKFNGGYFVGTTRSASSPFTGLVSPRGGLFVAASQARFTPSLGANTNACFVDVAYDGSPIQMTDETGKVLLSHKGIPSVVLADTLPGCYCIGGPFVANETYLYKWGGELKGDNVVGNTGFVLDGVYKGGNSLDVWADRLKFAEKIIKPSPDEEGD